MGGICAVVGGVAVVVGGVAGGLDAVGGICAVVGGVAVVVLVRETLTSSWSRMVKVLVF